LDAFAAEGRLERPPRPAQDFPRAPASRHHAIKPERLPDAGLSRIATE